MTVQITWRGDQWARAIVPAINRGLTAAAQVCADQAKSSMGRSPSSPGSPPGVDTGMLRASIVAVSPEALGTPLRSAFGTALPYGRHLEFGAHVTPKRSKYLFVPVDRGLAQKLNRIGAGGVRGMPGLKYIPPGRGRGGNYGGRFVLTQGTRVHVRGVRRQSRSVSPGTTVAILLKSVRILPRPWIRRAAMTAAPKARAAFVAVAKADLMSKGLVLP